MCETNKWTLSERETLHTASTVTTMIKKKFQSHIHSFLLSHVPLQCFVSLSLSLNSASCHCHYHSTVLRVTVTITQQCFVSLSLSLNSAPCHCHYHSKVLRVTVTINQQCFVSLSLSHNSASCQSRCRTPAVGDSVSSTGCTGNTQSPQHNSRTGHIRRCLAAGSGNPLPNSHQFTTHNYSKKLRVKASSKHTWYNVD